LGEHGEHREEPPGPRLPALGGARPVGHHISQYRTTYGDTVVIATALSARETPEGGAAGSLGAILRAHDETKRRPRLS
jgi:hypothetical protein